MYTYAGASTIGPGHLKKDQPCQDANKILRIKKGLFTMALADGVGSHKHSDLGAQEAVREGTKYIRDQYRKILPVKKSPQKILMDAAHHVHQHLRHYSKEHNIDFAELSTTLILIIYNNGKCHTLQIGDGAVVIQKPNGKLKVLNPPEESLYHNWVNPITIDNYKKHLRYHYCNNTFSVAGFTDGVEGSVISKTKDGKWEARQQFFQPFFQYLRALDDNKEAEQELTALLTSDKFNTASNDDKTLIVLAKHAETPWEAEL